MRHLTSDELVDLAEGARDDVTAPHLVVCDVCRQQLADLRTTLSAAADLSASGPEGDVPEPSPLFWEHLSARVRDAVRSEDVPARASWLERRVWPITGPRVAVGAIAGALIVAIVAALGSRVVAPGAPGTQTVVAPPAPVQPVEIVQNVQGPPALLGSPDDPSLVLVADYGGTLDWDELREQMAVSAHSGGLEATVSDLNSDERQELQRLLKEELARRPDRS